jgi:hypothetical protein
VVACAAVLAACGSAPAPEPIGAQIGPALTAALAAADLARAPWRCTAADGPTLTDETITLGTRSWTLAGSTVTLAGKGPVTIGVIADAGGAAPATLAALGRLRAELSDVDLVLALGGMGHDQAELEATLGALAEQAPWPIVAVPGDLEPAGELAAAVTALRARGRTVIDGRLARWIELPGVAIATVPGAEAASRLVAGAEGCGYSGDDVTRLIGELTGRPGLRVLATAEAPRVSVAGEAAGHLALTPGAIQEVDVVLHGPVTEAASGARAGARDAAAVALSPGTCDATTRLPGPRHAPSAGVLTVSGSAWRWRPIVDRPR